MTLDNFVLVHPGSSTSQRDQRREKSHRLSYVQSRRRQHDSKKQATQPWKAHTSLFALDATTASQGVSSSAASTEPNSETRRAVIASPKRPRVVFTLPSLFPTDNTSDPFYSTIAHSENGVNRLLHFTFHSLTNPTFLAEAFAPSAVLHSKRVNRHSRIIHRRLCECVGDAALMYSTLAYSASLSEWMGGHINKRKPPEYYTGTALAAVRLRLQRTIHSDRVDHWLLLSLYSLAITELWACTPLLWSRSPEKFNSMRRRHTHPVAVRTHLSALVELVSAYGGWKVVEPYLLESCLLVDKFAAIAQPAAPMIDLSWDPGPIPPLGTLPQPASGISEKERIILRDLGQGFVQAGLNPLLFEVLLNSVAYLQTALACWSMAAHVTTETETWLFRRLQALIHRLLHMVQLEQGIDICTRLVTLVTLLSTTDHHGTRVAAWLLLPHLQSALIQHRDLPLQFRFWCICTGALSAGQHSQEKAWFVNAAGTSLAEMGIELTKEAVELQLGQFLYVRSRQQVAVEDLVKVLKEIGRF
ncbi:hypothetical protein HJFPF1_08517 [Paramyrothecium foliicola]|nr:hypothetical protein HJFPF1_08517 [Paramyrothecium foliicola]